MTKQVDHIPLEEIYNDRTLPSTLSHYNPSAAPFLEGKIFWIDMLRKARKDEGYRDIVIEQLINLIYHMKIDIMHLEKAYDQLRIQVLPTQRHTRREVQKKGRHATR